MRQLLLALCLAITAAWGAERVTPVRYELAQALPPFRQARCVAPTADEAARLDLAVRAVETGPRPFSDWLEIGAQKLLATGLVREEGGGRSSFVCTPPALLARVAEAFEARTPGKGRFVEYHLELAARLPWKDGMLRLVAESAFAEGPQPSEIFGFKDLRPYARSVLATAGSAARPWRDVAFAQMGHADSLATGAAQVAAAGGHPEAPARIAKAMDALLDAGPRGKAVPWQSKVHLYELTWALVFAGDAAKGHTAPVHKVMSRKVQSHAPPFGMVDIDPKRMCPLLARLEGDAAPARYVYCGDPKAPLDM